MHTDLVLTAQVNFFFTHLVYDLRTSPVLLKFISILTVHHVSHQMSGDIVRVVEVTAFYMKHKLVHSLKMILLIRIEPMLKYM